MLKREPGSMPGRGCEPCAPPARKSSSPGSLAGALRASNSASAHEWRTPAVIVLSANRGYEAEDLGVAAIVRKPFDVDALVGNIARVLGKAAPAAPAGAPP